MKHPERLRHSLVVLCGLLMWGSLAAPVSAASVNVPLDHWSYRDIDTLIGFGLIRTAMLGSKPFSRDEMARLIAEAIPRREALPYRQRRVANRLLKRLLRAFQDEVNARTGNQEVVPTTYIKPLADISSQFVYLDGVPTRMLPENSIDATEGTPLLRNNEGVTYRDGANLMLTASTYGKLWDHFAFFAQPLFLLRPATDGGVLDADPRLHKGYLKASLGPFELEFGRDSIWWGQGYRGTLIFSNHARPLDFVQLGIPQPVRLPWILRYLGGFKFDAFLAFLGNDRDRSGAKLVGLRAQIKPWWWLELGVVAGTQLDGAGVPGLTFTDVLQLLILQNPGGDQANPTNQLIAVDVRVTLPFLRYSQIYFEYGGEDARDFGNSPVTDEGLELLFADVAYLAGLYVPRLTDDGRTTFRFEWMQNDFANHDDAPFVWYTHSTYRSGFTFKNRILGHAAGGDGGEVFWRLTRDIGHRLILAGDFSYQWRGDVLLNDAARPACHDNTKTTGCKKERHYGGGIDLQYFITNNWEARTRFAVERVQNFNLIRGEERTNSIFWLNLSYHFS